jgi:hypothetical protein
MYSFGIYKMSSEFSDVVEDVGAAETGAGVAADGMRTPELTALGKETTDADEEAVGTRTVSGAGEDRAGGGTV